MSNYYFVTGTSDSALCLGKRPWWRELLAREFKTVDELSAAINAKLTEEGRVSAGEWTPAEVRDLAERIWALGTPFRVWYDEDCRDDLDKDYTIVEGPYQDVDVGASLGDYLFGYYPTHNIIPRDKLWGYR